MKVLNTEIILRKTAEINLDEVPKEVTDALKKQFPKLELSQVDVLISKCGCDHGHCYCSKCA